jgi:hypothetical protein
VTTPYIPFTGGQSPLRPLYRSRVQVTRLMPSLTDQGGMVTTWENVTDICDPYLDKPGLMMCRLDLTFLRPGKDQPAPLVAGRAPDRIGVCYYDPATDANGIPYVKAGDRLACVAGPIYGTFEIRTIPDVAQDFTGAHHIEVQVIEVAQQLVSGPNPFPGGAP